MDFLLVAIPLIFVIIVVVLLAVFLGNSTKYLEKLDTSKKLELEKLKQEAIERINDLKTNNGKKILIDKELANSQKIMSEIQKQNVEIESISKTILEYKKHIEKKANKKQMEDIYIDKNSQPKKLVFNNKNLVRGIIANEYLNKRNVSRRR